MVASSDKTDVELAAPKAPRGAWAYLNDIIDSKKSNPISLYACFLTGYTSALSFSVGTGARTQPRQVRRC
jgi:hypothetical protein